MVWLPVLCGAVVLLVAASLLTRPIVGAVQTRWPAFDVDAQSLLTWGVVLLGFATALVLAMMVLGRI